MKKAILIALAALFIHGSVQAEESASLTGADIMKLSEGQRHWWYTGVFTGLGHVASTDPTVKDPQCVWKWYFDDPKKRKAQLEEAFKQYPEYLPTGVIIAFVKRDCDAFKGNK